jgi:integrase
VVELSSVVVASLKRIPRRIGEDLIFHDCGNVSHRFPEWVKDAKLTGIVSFHTLRHTFASRLVMAGVDLLTVQSLGGWKDLAMVQRYAHLAPAHRREAIEALARGETLQRSGTGTGTRPQEASQTDSAAVSVSY